MTFIEIALRPKSINRFVFLVIFSLILIYFSQPIYGTTDDKILAGFIDGSYTGEPEMQTIFIQPIISLILTPLYYFLPSFGWYAIFQVGIVIIALSLVPPALNSVKPILNNYFLALSLFILCWYVPKITFTSSAILTFLLAYLSIILYLISGEKSKLKIVIVVFMFIFSFYLRPEAVIGISILLILPIVKYFKNIMKCNKSLLLVFLVLISLLTSVNLLLREFNSSEEWNKYNEWNSYRHQIQNRILQDNLWRDLDKISWSPAEHNLFLSLSYGDPNTFNSQWIKPAFESSRSSAGLSGLINATPAHTLQKTIWVIQKYSVEIFYLLFLSTILLILVRTRKTVFYIFATWIQGLTLVYYMAATLHTPERVVIPLFIGCTIICLVLVLDQNISRLIRINSVSTVTLASFVALIVTPGGLYHDYVDRKEEINNSIKAKQVLGNYDENYILLGSVGTEVNHLVNPYLSSNFEQDLKIITVGNWETFSPHWYKRNLKLGIESKNIYQDLIKNPRVLWVTKEIPDTAYQVELYLREQNVSDFERRSVTTGLNGLNVFRFTPD